MPRPTRVAGQVCHPHEMPSSFNPKPEALAGATRGRSTALRAIASGLNEPGRTEGVIS